MYLKRGWINLVLLFCAIHIVSAQYGGYYWTHCLDGSGNVLTGNYAYFSYCSSTALNTLINTYGTRRCTPDAQYTLYGCQYTGFSVTDSCPVGYYSYQYKYYINPTSLNCISCGGVTTTESLINYNSYAGRQYVSNGNFNDDCQWTCSQGYKTGTVTYYVPPYYTTTISKAGCIKCGFNEYSTSPFSECTQCPAYTLPVLIDAYTKLCSVGQYYVLRADCSLGDCKYCSTKPPNTYFVKINGYSADSSRADSCYTAPCQTCTEVGTHKSSCGTAPGNLASSGICVKCTNIATFANYETPSDLRYYVAGTDANGDCSTATCIPCNAGYYNTGCPVSGGATIAQTCTKCNDSPILNSAFLVATGYVSSPDLCPQTCAVGFYQKATTFGTYTCDPCLASDVCAPGYYTEVCNSYGTAGNAAVCVQCPNANLPSSPYVSWAKSSAGYGSSACTWQCLKGYYRSSNTCAACTVTGITCAAGSYIKAVCLDYAGSSEPPSCAACAPIPNSIYNNQILINPDSCNNVSCVQGFWRSSSTTCTAWTPSPVTPCDWTYFWGEGSGTIDNHCVKCPSLDLPPNFTIPELQLKYTFLEVNKCAWTCGPGFTPNPSQPQQCIACESGKFKNLAGTAACQLCAPQTYQLDTYAAQECIQIPDNSIQMDNRAFYLCNQGYEAVTNIYGRVCQLCSVQDPNIKSISFTPNTCFASAFLCNSGFYRQLTSLISRNISNNAKCVACSTNIVANSIPQWSTISSTVDSVVTGQCQNFPSCPDMNDEINIACPISCADGSYKTSTKKTGNSITDTLACPLCTAVTCTAGKTSSPCKTGTTNICITCSQTLTAGQVWISYDGTCTWQCTYGYTLAPLSTTACQQCAVGAYKSVISNGGCTSCALGYYSNIAAASSCSVCAPGTYSSLVGSATCLTCQAGSFATGNGATTCAICQANYISPSTTSSQCTQCPVELPYSPLGGASCGLSPPPCQAGFYFESVALLLCAQCASGTFCPGGLDANGLNQMPLLCAWTSSMAMYTPLRASSQADCSRNTTTGNCIRATASTIQSCPSNTGTRGYAGAKSLVWCHPNAGYYGLPGVAAQPCPQDFYCTFGVTTTNPTACPPTTPYAPAMSMFIGNCSVKMYPPCRPKYYYLAPTFAGGSATCLPCPQSSYCPGGNSSSSGPIIACSTYYNWTSPALSDKSSLCSFVFISATITCPSNTAIPIPPINTEIFRISVLQCRATAGFYFIPGVHVQGIACPSGFVCPAETLVPIPCPPTTCMLVGFTQTSNICPTQSSQVLPECVACVGLIPNAHYTQVNSCSFCCNAGYVLTQSGSTLSCILIASTLTCPESKYMPVPDACAVSITTCTSCPIPTTQGSAAPSLSLRTSMINSGQLPLFGVEACLLGCLPGYYNDDASTCKTCPIGTFRGSDISFNATLSSCISCDHGKYAYNVGSTQCKTCGSWTISASNDYCTICSVWSSTSPPFCKVCGQWSLITRANCTCMQGTYQAAPQSDGTLNCLECPIGSISLPDAPYSCYTCPPGQVCTNFMPAQVCPAGWYRSTSSSTCMPCLKGLMSSSAESSQCTPCAPGSYSDVSGGTSCTPCPSNTYLPTSGGYDLSQCMSCQTWVPGAASTAGSAWCGCPASTFFDGNQCRTCTPACHPNATMSTPCGFGSTYDTVVCACKIGFSGDGITSCTACDQAFQCACPRAYYYDYVDIKV